MKHPSTSVVSCVGGCTRCKDKSTSSDIGARDGAWGPKKEETNAIQDGAGVCKDVIKERAAPHLDDEEHDYSADQDANPRDAVDPP
eukprot:3481967-Rhodomonas_salina.1